MPGTEHTALRNEPAAPRLALLLDASVPKQQELLQAVAELDECRIIKPRLARRGLHRYVVKSKDRNV